MFLGAQDYKNSMMKRITGDNKVDPGTFSMGEAGWWVLHAAAIAGVYALGSRLAKKPY